MFNALLIARAPLQLFQAIQTSLLPHLTGLEATEGHEAFARAIRVDDPGHRRLRRRRGARAAARSGRSRWTSCSATATHYGRVGLALIAVGMGLHLSAGTLNQAALARDHARAAAACWLLSRRVVRRLDARRPSSTTSCCAPRSATLGAAALLCALLRALYRR